MTSVKDKTDKLVEYIDEAKKIGIEVLPPDVNESLVDFTVVGERDSVRLSRRQGRRRRRGSRHHRDAGAATAASTDLFDLAERVDAKQVNRRVFEALIKCGALDGIAGKSRAEARGARYRARACRADDARCGAGAGVALRGGERAIADARAEAAQRRRADDARDALVGA